MSTDVFEPPHRERIAKRVAHLYGAEAAAPLLDRFATSAAAHGLPKSFGPRWDERSAALITYGDQISAQNVTPLVALRDFLVETGLDTGLSDVHLLPCFPYTSDDGFSVSNYDIIDPALGDWADVASLGEYFGLMLDLVLNHCSQEHRWFQAALKGEEPFVRYFHNVDPATDLSGVVRPRSLPLLSPYETAGGTQHFWTTFSADQIDLNFSSTELLAEMVDVLLRYVGQGGRIIRLDAIAYLWKTIGTSCIHLEETHQVVKLFRDLFDALCPDAILLTETNVPHEENVSYFGDGDEAHMVYQFSLAPLVLDAYLHQDATYLNDWLSNLEPPGRDTTYFNFTASHDGVGVRPLEGLVPTERRDSLVEKVRERGGRVSTKRNSDGSESPYELNATYFSALSDSDGSFHERRFLGSQALMVALQGVPGVYVHSLFGTPNWEDGVAETGRARTINRRKFRREELDGWLQKDGPRKRLFEAMRSRLTQRASTPAFHPENAQRVHNVDPQRFVVVERPAFGSGDAVWSVTNVTNEAADVALPDGRSVSVDGGETKWV